MLRQQHSPKAPPKSSYTTHLSSKLSQINQQQGFHSIAHKFNYLIVYIYRRVFKQVRKPLNYNHSASFVPKLLSVHRPLNYHELILKYPRGIQHATLTTRSKSSSKESHLPHAS